MRLYDTRGRAVTGGTMVLGLVVVGALGLVSLAARPKPEPCPDGRYLVDGSALLSGVATTPADGISIAAGQIALDGACPAVAGKVKTKRRGTNVKASWPLCDGVEGKVRLKGKIEPTCQTFTGKVIAKKEHVKEEFTAILSTCGDGTVDPGTGEECDTGEGCTPPATCTDVCACTDATTTTTFGGGTTTSATFSSSTTTTTTPTTTSTIGGGSTTSTTLPTVPGPDPATVAPVNDPTVAPDFAASTAFLFAGTPPIQFNVDPDAIEFRRVAVLRGRIVSRDGASLAAVLVRVKDHPEFGQTLSRSDGMYDLAVNGGGNVVLDYTRAGFLPAQRIADDVPWRDFVRLPDLTMLAVDAQVTDVGLGAAATTMQIAQGSAQTDGDGTRQATLLIPPGTQASMRMPDGSTQPLSNVAVRATEYTVGTTGPSTMPGQLPAQSGYTFAVEFSADEALGAGASSVEFDRPLPTYVENFLGFPAGTPVPAGYYDRDRAAWVPSIDGRVIDIVGTTGDLADLDVTGDGAADSGAALSDLGITDEERQRLATLYAAGQSLWRVPVTHFTPWDYNWPFGLPDDAEGPTSPPAQEAGAPIEGACEEPGSVIRAEDQTLGEFTEIVGTPYVLHYSSDRVPGRSAAVDVPLAGDTVPPGLKRIELTMEVAGQRHEETFSATAGQRTTFVWDGFDAYGRSVPGAARAHGKIDYVYDAVYRTPAQLGQNFATFGGTALTANRARQEISVSQEFDVTVDHEDARAYGLGAWMLNVHHVYDPQAAILRLGDGRRRRAEMLTPVIETAARVFNSNEIAVADDGSVLVGGATLLQRRAPDGTMSTVAGGGSAPPPGRGDGGPAIEASFNNVGEIALGPGGTIYVVDACSIRRIGPDGIITTVAGIRGPEGDECNGGLSPLDGVPATSIPVSPRMVAVAPDGTVYFYEFGFSEADTFSRVRRIDAGGIIYTAVGGLICFTGTPCADAGGPVAEARMQIVDDIEFGPDGSLYILEGTSLLRRVTPDGIVEYITGQRGVAIFTPSGTQASAGFLCNAHGLAVTPDGAVNIAEETRVRRITPEGLSVIIGGSTQPSAFGFCDPDVRTIDGDGGPSLGAGVAGTRGIASAPDGSLFITSGFPRALGRIGRPLPGVTANDFPVASDDGSEVYVFASSGRHLRTLDALTGLVVREFTYDADGLLASIGERAGSVDSVTTIERNASGAPLAIVGPFGDRTTLALDSNGYLSSISNPAGETLELSSGPTGLLSDLTDPRGHVTSFAYDVRGALLAETDPVGGGQTLARTNGEQSFEVVHETALDLATTFVTETLASGALRRTVTAPDGTQTQVVSVKDGSRTFTTPEGHTIDERDAPDPRFGMLVPLLEQRTVRTPSGLTRTSGSTRTATFTTQVDLTAQTETLTVNGRNSSIAFTKSAGGSSFVGTSPAGRTTTYTLDAFGRLAQAQMPGLEPATMSYDDRGRLSALQVGSGPAARTTTFVYDATGYLAEMTDPLARTFSFTYDAAGRTATETRPDGRIVSFGYDAGGNLVRVTPPGRPDHTFTYSDRDELLEIAPPVGAGGGPTTYGHDLDGRLDTVTRADGTGVVFEYDTGGRLARRALTTGAVTNAESALIYTASGQLASATTDGGVAVSFDYDGRLLTDETTTGPAAGSVGWTYDASFRVVDETVAGTDPVSFAYDDDDLLTGVGALTIARDAQLGLPTATTLGVVSDSLTYDGFGAPASFAAAAGATSFYEADYTRDALGRLTEQVETIDGSTSVVGYTYDLAGRLVEVRRDGTLVEEYAYDENGNRTTATALSATFDDRDRLLQQGATVFAYAPSGRLQSRTTGVATTAYEYDAVGNLVSVDLPDGRVVTYVVDGFDRRVAKRIDGTLTQGFLWAGDRIVAELDGAGTIVSRFVGVGSGAPLAVIRGGVAHRLVLDQLGSVRLVVDTESGAIVQRLDYDAFGNVTLDTNPGFQPFGFAGGLYDGDTELVRFGVRDYDAATGRWTAPDPVSFGGRDTNLYRYAAGDPVNMRDRSGLSVGGFASGVLEGITSFDNPVLVLTGIGPTLKNFFDPLHGIPEEGRTPELVAALDPWGMSELGIDSVSEIIEAATGLRETASEYEDDPANTVGFVCGLIAPVGGPKAGGIASRGKNLLSRGRGALDDLLARLKSLLPKKKQPPPAPKPSKLDRLLEQTIRDVGGNGRIDGHSGGRSNPSHRGGPGG